MQPSRHASCVTIEHSSVSLIPFFPFPFFTTQLVCLSRMPSSMPSRLVSLRFSWSFSAHSKLLSPNPILYRHVLPYLKLSIPVLSALAFHVLLCHYCCCPVCSITVLSCPHFDCPVFLSFSQSLSIASILHCSGPLPPLTSPIRISHSILSA
jgi:hypothetical protein